MSAATSPGSQSGSSISPAYVCRDPMMIGPAYARRSAGILGAFTPGVHRVSGRPEIPERRGRMHVAVEIGPELLAPLLGHFLPNRVRCGVAAPIAVDERGAEPVAQEGDAAGRGLNILVPGFCDDR